MSEFYKNLKILSQDLYKKSAVAQTNYRGNNSNAVNSSPQRRGSRNVGLIPSASRASFFGGTPSDEMSSAALAAAAFGESSSKPVMTAESAYQTHPVDYFTSDALMERMKLYAQQGGIPMDYIERYTQQSTSKGSIPSTNST
jgi:hypothetical protein